MRLVRRAAAYVLASLVMFATGSVAQAAPKVFGDLAVGEKAFIWLDDFCTDLTAKGGSSTVAVKADQIVREGPDPDGEYAIALGLTDGIWVQLFAPDGSNDPEDGVAAYMAFIRSISNIERPPCSQPNGAMRFTFGIPGNNEYSEDFSIRELNDF